MNEEMKKLVDNCVKIVNYLDPVNTKEELEKSSPEIDSIRFVIEEQKWYKKTEEGWMLMGEPKGVGLFDFKPLNIEGERRFVYHKNLARFSEDSPYKSKCPFCENGILIIYRESVSPFRLRSVDYCISCGQEVEYLDIEDLRKQEGNE